MGLTYRSRLALLLLFPELLSCGGGGGGGDDEASQPTEAAVGPEGGELAVKPSDPAYGFRVVIPAGALAERRTITLDGYRTAYAPTRPNKGFIACEGGVAGLRTRGATPYGVPMTVHAPLGAMTAAAGEIVGLFGYASAADEWHLMAPDAVSRDTAGAAVLSVRTTWHDFFAWGKVVMTEIPTDYLRQVVDARYGTGTSAAAAAELARITALAEFRQLHPHRDSLLALRNGFLEVFKQGQAAWLRDAEKKLGGCGLCEVLSDRFLDDAMTYAGNLIRIKWWSFFVGPDLGDNVGELLVNVMLWVHLINLYAENERFACNYKCVTDTCGGTFWQVFTGYWFAVICQELIDTAIANNWV